MESATGLARTGACCLAAIVWSMIAAPASHAGAADVLEVHATCTTIRTCDFQVKVRHADVGMSHYADRFEIVAPDGEVLGTRVLRHPHVHEQPFVRGLVGVEIPEGVHEVSVRARDSKHGFGGRMVELTLEFPEKGGPPTEAGDAARSGAGPPPAD